MIADMYASAWVTPLRQYQKMIDSGTLQGDDHQTRIIQKLQDLHNQLISYKPPQIPDAPSGNTLVTFQLGRRSAMCSLPSVAFSDIQPRCTYTHSAA